MSRDSCTRSPECWLSAPDDAVRDGSRAMTMVQDLLKGPQTLELGETMAMTLAELGTVRRRRGPAAQSAVGGHAGGPSGPCSGNGQQPSAVRAPTAVPSALDGRTGLPRSGDVLRVGPRSPTMALLIGLIITLTAVVTYSWYITRQISGLRVLQTDLADRNRRDSLQLLRIQNDLNSLGLAMRDMLDSNQAYPLTAWSAQLQRLRLDLDDALRREEQIAVARQTPEQRRYLASSLAQFWDAVDRMFELARNGREDEARVQIELSLQARQAALTATVARLLVQNNEAEEQTARRVQDIYGQVQRQVYWLLTAHSGGHRGHEFVSDLFESAALCQARVALGRASRTGPKAHLDTRVDAP